MSKSTAGDGYKLQGSDVALVPPTPEQARHAALICCEVATDIDDAALLIDALGLRTWMA